MMRKQMKTKYRSRLATRSPFLPRETIVSPKREEIAHFMPPWLRWWGIKIAIILRSSVLSLTIIKPSYPYVMTRESVTYIPMFLNWCMENSAFVRTISWKSFCKRSVINLFFSRIWVKNIDIKIKIMIFENSITYMVK